MTLRGDRVYCDVPGCIAKVRGFPYGWLALSSNGTCRYICPGCRAAHTDDELRAKLARQETKT